MPYRLAVCATFEPRCPPGHHLGRIKPPRKPPFPVVAYLQAMPCRRRLAWAISEPECLRMPDLRQFDNLIKRLRRDRLVYAQQGDRLAALLLPP